MCFVLQADETIFCKDKKKDFSFYETMELRKVSLELRIYSESL